MDTSSLQSSEVGEESERSAALGGGRDPGRTAGYRRHIRGMSTSAGLSLEGSDRPVDLAHTNLLRSMTTWRRPAYPLARRMDDVGWVSSEHSC